MRYHHTVESGRGWLELLRLLPRPLCYGIGTGIMLAIFARIALPPLERVEDVSPIVEFAATTLRVVIAFMPYPKGLIVFGFYLHREYRAARRGYDQ